MQTTSAEQKAAARDFVTFWKDKVHIDSAHGFIDGYIPATYVLVEQKSLGMSLRSGRSL